jgi:hypothetical protein
MLILSTPLCNKSSGSFFSKDFKGMFPYPGNFYLFIKKIFTLILFLSIGHTVSLAQKKATGKVSGINGLPLAGVSITVKGRLIGAQTDTSGIFSINAKANDLLIFSFVDYESREIKIGQDLLVYISLSPSWNNLNTVVVTGYMYEGYQSDSLFIPYSGSLDPRLDWTVGRRGIPYLDWGNHPGYDWIRFQPYGGPYSPIKNAVSQIEFGTYTDNAWGLVTLTANNINLIRFADILLWDEEAQIKLGNVDSARFFVNWVRGRAADPNSWVHTYIDPNDPTKGFTNIKAANYNIGLYPIVWTDPAFALSAVQFERVLEFGMEGHRFFDLVRWGIADSEINSYFSKEKIKRTFLSDANFKKGINEYFPIPQVQINLSGGADGLNAMTQNPGY